MSLRPMLTIGLFALLLTSRIGAQDVWTDPIAIARLTRPATGGGGSELTTALVAWWEHEEADGADRTDSTGNGHTLTQHGTVLQVSPSKNGTFASSLGNLKFLDNNESVFKTASDFTIAGWVSGLGNDAGWIVSRYSSGQICWYVYGIGNHLTMFIRNSADSSEYSVPSAVNVTTAGYHHVAAGMSGTTAFFQVDGEARLTTSTDGLRTTTSALTFADLAGGTGSATPCKMDAWGFWNVALTTGSVTTLQTAFYPGF